MRALRNSCHTVCQWRQVTLGITRRLGLLFYLRKLYIHLNLTVLRLSTWDKSSDYWSRTSRVDEISWTNYCRSAVVFDPFLKGFHFSGGHLLRTKWVILVDFMPKQGAAELDSVTVNRSFNRTIATCGLRCAHTLLSNIAKPSPTDRLLITPVVLRFPVPYNVQ